MIALVAIAKRIVVSLSALAAITGVSACAGKYGPSPAQVAQAALSQKSFNDGETAGKANAVRATSDGLMKDGACRTMAATMMPKRDIESDWVTGCVDGGLMGLIHANQSAGGSSG